MLFVFLTLNYQKGFTGFEHATNQVYVLIDFVTLLFISEVTNGI